METLSQIMKTDRDRLERAARYESLVGMQTQQQATITRLEGAPINLDALRRILELTVDVPDGLTTRSKQFMPGGFEARDVLSVVAADALATAQAKADKRDAQLTAARTALANVEAELSALKRSA